MKEGISIVVPVYNSEKTLKQLVERISATMDWEKKDFEIILVDDSSTDSSWEVIERLSTKNEHVRGIKLLKNYGQHTANLCGFNATRFKYIATIDDDLQNPPEEIPALLKEAEAGTELVIGRFKQKKHSRYRRVGSRAVQNINRRIFNLDNNLSITNARVFQRIVFERFAKTDIPSPYIPGLLFKHAHTICNIDIDHHPRKSGKSQYTLLKLIRLTSRILFVHSKIPLRVATFLGAICSMGALLLALTLLALAFIRGFSVPGWASQMVVISFFSALQIALLSIVGEYLLELKKSLDSNERYIVYKRTHE